MASNNPGKLIEFASLLRKSSYKIFTPEQVGIPSYFDPEETGITFAENAEVKARAYAEKCNLLTISDDSGLEVDALKGRPGVFSKRYGDTDEERISKLLSEMTSIPPDQRTARFVCVLCLYNPQTRLSKFYEGIVEGKVAMEAKGTRGFGYDPVFIPTEIEGNSKTFGQLGSTLKNKISHRAKALSKLKAALE